MAAQREEMRDDKGDEREAEIELRVAEVLSRSEPYIQRDKIRNILGAMKRIAGEMKSEGDDFELDPRMAKYLKELGLTDEQMKLVLGLSKRIAWSESETNREREDRHER